MAELVSVVIGFGVELLLQGVIDEVKQAVDRNKNCKALLVLLEGLAPLVQFLCDSSKKGQGQNKSTPVTEWLEKLRSRLEEADKVVRECISQGSRPWNIVKNRSTSKKLVEVKGLRKLENLNLSDTYVWNGGASSKSITGALLRLIRIQPAAILQDVASLTSLTTLKISNLSILPGPSYPFPLQLSCLKSLRHLEELELEKTKSLIELPPSLASLPKLRILHLRECGAGDNLSPEFNALVAQNRLTITGKVYPAR